MGGGGGGRLRRVANTKGGGGGNGGVCIAKGTVTGGEHSSHSAAGQKSWGVIYAGVTTGLRQQSYLIELVSHRGSRIDAREKDRRLAAGGENRDSIKKWKSQGLEGNGDVANQSLRQHGGCKASPVSVHRERTFQRS